MAKMKFDREEEKVAGFLNIQLKKSDGTFVRLRKGIPLMEGNVVERSLLNAVRASENGELELNCVGTVYLTREDSAEDIAFAL